MTVSLKGNIIYSKPEKGEEKLKRNTCTDLMEDLVYTQFENNEN